MFTGIVLDVGRIRSFTRESGQAHAVIETALDTSGWSPGDSVAVDGCCLTVTDLPRPGAFAATLSGETLELTRFGRVDEGEAVNLEPALKVGDALGGHLVSGHIDGIARVAEVAPLGEHRRVTFELPDEMARYVVTKGSATVNGVSLTVNEIPGARFTVNLIPHTLSHTNLGGLKAGDAVNLETDQIARYVERLLAFDPRLLRP